MKQILTRLFNTERLSRGEARELMLKLTAGECNDSQIASLLTVYQMRTVDVEEFIGFREGLLATRVPVDFSPYQPIDIVGTGGDGKNTFNISTCACFVVAGAGYKVAKHGNYGATSVSGASNVIENHGVKFTTDNAKLMQSMEECNIAYLHAPLFNPAMKNVAGVRRALQVRTLFNLLGPVVNPCLPTHQLLGVADLAQMRLYCNVFQTLGIKFAVVSSLDRYDEISLTDKFKVETDRYEMVRTPADFGMTKVNPRELYGGSTPKEACAIFDNVLAGRSTQGQKDVVVINAAFAMQVLDPTMPIDESIARARESIDSGAALATLRKFVAINS